jgi:hypothetical protein
MGCILLNTYQILHTAMENIYYSFQGNVELNEIYIGPKNKLPILGNGAQRKRQMVIKVESSSKVYGNIWLAQVGLRKSFQRKAFPSHNEKNNLLPFWNGFSFYHLLFLKPLYSPIFKCLSMSTGKLLSNSFTFPDLEHLRTKNLITVRGEKKNLCPSLLYRNFPHLSTRGVSRCPEKN